MIDRLLLVVVAVAGAVVAASAAAWSFATTTENVSLIGGGGILASSIGLSIFLLRVWAKDAARARAIAIVEGDRADRAEYRLGICRELMDLNGISVPGNYYTWPIPAKAKG